MEWTGSCTAESLCARSASGWGVAMFVCELRLEWGSSCCIGVQCLNNAKKRVAGSTMGNYRDAHLQSECSSTSKHVLFAAASQVLPLWASH
jgi:hypothetical protein